MRTFGCVRPVVLALVLLITARSVGASEIHGAVRENDLELVRQILDIDGNAGVHAVLPGGVTPLHIAAALDNEAAMELLLERGAETEAQTDQGFTPLHWAAGRDAAAAAGVLIASGANVNAVAKGGVTPLHWAASNNATNVIRRLLLAGADARSATSTGLEPLHWAVREQAEAAAAMLAYSRISAEMPAPIFSVATSGVDVAAMPEEPELAGNKPAPAKSRALPMSPSQPALQELVVDLGRDQELVFVWIEPVGLLVGKYEVSNGQFRRFRPGHNSLFRAEFTLNDDEQPAVFVSWEDAAAFCDWLDRSFPEYLPREGRYRLPTREEWCAFARCGTDRTYPWGDEWPPVYGNYSDLTARRNLSKWRGISGYDDGHAVTCRVGAGGVNEWGLYGLAGNVWEWCEDWFDASKTAKVRCGGSWDFDEEPCLRINARGFDRPNSKYATIGFRVVIGR